LWRKKENKLAFPRKFTQFISRIRIQPATTNNRGFITPKDSLPLLTHSLSLSVVSITGNSPFPRYCVCVFVCVALIRKPQTETRRRLSELEIGKKSKEPILLQKISTYLAPSTLFSVILRSSAVIDPLILIDGCAIAVTDNKQTNKSSR